MAKVKGTSIPSISYNSIDDKDVLRIIDIVRNGIEFNNFVSIVEKSLFPMNEWSGYLHLSERTMLRYKKTKHTFDAVHSERILQITLLNKFGIEVFGNAEKFNKWLETENLALGKIKPKTLLDNAFGINLLKDELTRIEHGVLA